MGRYQRLGSAGRLGSFEGHGMSNTFGNQFGNMTMDERQRNEIASDIATAGRSAPDSKPNFQYYEFRGKTAAWVVANGPTYAKRNEEEIRAAAADSGASAGEVLTGISAILAPLAQMGVGIYGAQQQAKMQKMQMRSGGGFQQQQQPIVIPAQSSNTGIIIAVVVVFLIMGMMFMMMKGKK